MRPLVGHGDLRRRLRRNVPILPYVYHDPMPGETHFGAPAPTEPAYKRSFHGRYNDFNFEHRVSCSPRT